MCLRAQHIPYLLNSWTPLVFERLSVLQPNGAVALDSQSMTAETRLTGPRRVTHHVCGRPPKRMWLSPSPFIIRQLQTLLLPFTTCPHACRWRSDPKLSPRSPSDCLLDLPCAPSFGMANPSLSYMVYPPLLQMLGQGHDPGLGCMASPLPYVIIREGEMMGGELALLRISDAPCSTAQTLRTKTRKTGRRFHFAYCTSFICHFPSSKILGTMFGCMSLEITKKTMARAAWYKELNELAKTVEDTPQLSFFCARGWEGQQQNGSKGIPRVTMVFGPNPAFF